MTRGATGGRANLGLLMIAALLAGTMWLYAGTIYQPHSLAIARSGGVTAGPYPSDLYPAWEGARAALWQGRNPYSPAVTADIQRGTAGRVLAADDPVRVTNAYVYPLYSVFLLAPLTLLPFSVVLPLMYVLLPLLYAGLVVGWLAALGWRGERAIMAALVLLGLSTLPAVNIFFSQQPTALVVALVTGAAVCLRRGAERAAAGRARWYMVAGGLLALSTFKLQLSVVPICWLVGWALCDWRARRGLLVGLGGSLTVLVGGALLLQPTWPADWWAALEDYGRYAGGPSLLAVLLLGVPGGAVTALVVGLGLALAGVLWHSRRASPGDLAFDLGWALTGLYTLVLVPRVAPDYQLLCYPAALLIFQQRARLRSMGRAAGLLSVLALDLVLWPWVCALLVLISAAAVPWQLPWIVLLLNPLVLLVPLVVLAVGTLRPAVRPMPVAEVAVHE